MLLRAAAGFGDGDGPRVEPLPSELPSIGRPPPARQASSRTCGVGRCVESWMSCRKCSLREDRCFTGNIDEFESGSVCSDSSRRAARRSRFGWTCMCRAGRHGDEGTVTARSNLGTEPHRDRRLVRTGPREGFHPVGEQLGARVTRLLGVGAGWSSVHQ